MADAIYESEHNKMHIMGSGKSTFRSILDLEESPGQDEGRPPFYLDLNLDQIIGRICKEWGDDMVSFYYYFPKNARCENYRREIFADVKQESCYKALCGFLDEMKARQDILEKKEAVRLEMQKAMWQMKEVLCYCDAFRRLSEALMDIPLQSEGMAAFRADLRQYLEGEEFMKMRERAVRLQEAIAGFRLVLTYENGRVTVSQGEAEGAYGRFLENALPLQKHGRELKNPFGALADLVELEQEILRICQKKNPGLFKEVWNFYRAYGNYASDTLLQFASEIRYYLAFCSFEKKMEEKGFAFGRPQIASGEMYAEGLYDLALACTVNGERKIVSNDFRYGAGDRFFVLTGPNQGGKTTFARSLGQLVYFTKMGLDVPARSASMPYFTSILTHFSVEESVDTGRGKLKEELVRLAPMMEGSWVSDVTEKRQEKSSMAQRTLSGNQAQPSGAFVIINELFTTAANYDACIMGKRVLDYFLARGARGIYVTHLKELAQEGAGIVSLRAMLDSQGRQTFKVARGQAEDSASAVNQVRKYRLTYEELKERLS